MAGAHAHPRSATRLAAALALAFLARTAPVLCGTIHVPSPGIASIQDGIDAAAPGDLVLVAAGTYVGTVRIEGKPGLELRGAGAVVVDARPAGVASGSGIHVDLSAGARLSKLTVRHAGGVAPDDAGVRVTGSAGVRLKDLDVLHGDGPAFVVEGDAAELVDCSAQGNAGGIAVTGDGARLLRCRVQNDRAGGIAVAGDDAALERSEAGSIRGGGGIAVTGERPDVLRCRVLGVFDDASNGITTTGANPRIEKNVVRFADVGIQVVYGGDGAVRDNLVEDCGDDAYRFGTVSFGLTIEGNVARRCGGDCNAAGFRLGGDGHFVRKNRAERCAGDGFVLASASLTLKKNVALANLADGFDVDAGANDALLEDNVAEKNHGEGFDNGGSNTTLIGNASRKNRVPFANDGSVAAATGNDFETAGAPAPQID